MWFKTHKYGYVEIPILNDSFQVLQTLARLAPNLEIKCKLREFHLTLALKEIVMERVTITDVQREGADLHWLALWEMLK